MILDRIITTVLSIILLVVPVVILSDRFMPYNSLKIIILLVCGLILLIATLLRFEELKCDKTDMVILIFGLFAVLSTIFSLNIHKSICGAYNRFEGLATIIIYILIYYNSKYYFRKYRYFTKIISIIYILICILAIVQFYVKNSIDIPPIFARGANGTFGNVNFMGSFISIILPAFILLAIFKNKKLYYIGSIVGFSAMIMCVTRSSWVAFFVTMLLIIIYLAAQKNKKYNKRFVIIIALFVCCFIFINLSDSANIISNKINVSGQEFSEMFETGVDNSFGSGRIEIWKLTLKLIGKVPAIGCGVDALTDGLNHYLPDEMAEYFSHSHVVFDKAHNEYLQIAATMGIPALLCYLTFISMIVLGGLKLCFKHKIIALYLIIIISYLSQAFFNISTIGVAPIFYFVLGMASRCISYKSN